MENVILLFGCDEQGVESIEDGENCGEVLRESEGELGEQVATVKVFLWVVLGGGGEELGKRRGLEQGFLHEFLNNLILILVSN